LADLLPRASDTNLNRDGPTRDQASFISASAPTKRRPKKSTSEKETGKAHDVAARDPFSTGLR
jgi:hypothetical protein